MPYGSSKVYLKKKKRTIPGTLIAIQQRYNPGHFLDKFGEYVKLWLLIKLEKDLAPQFKKLKVKK
jgi:hypothetical protein